MSLVCGAPPFLVSLTLVLSVGVPTNLPASVPHLYPYGMYRCSDQIYRSTAWITYCPGCRESILCFVLLILYSLNFLQMLMYVVFFPVAYCLNISMGSLPQVRVREFKLVLTYLCSYITSCFRQEKKNQPTSFWMSHYENGSCVIILEILRIDCNQVL